MSIKDPRTQALIERLVQDHVPTEKIAHLCGADTEIVRRFIRERALIPPKPISVTLEMPAGLLAFYQGCAERREKVVESSGRRPPADVSAFLVQLLTGVRLRGSVDKLWNHAPISMYPETRRRRREREKETA